MKMLSWNNRGSAWPGFILRPLASRVQAAAIAQRKHKQKQLWTDILDFKPRGFEAWILMGDFNNICTSNEKLGGPSTVPAVLAEFNDFINDCEVFSLNAAGVPFT
ncbi:unnamed protein product [Prunus armeniaca]